MLCVWVCAHAQILLLHTNVDVCVCLVCVVCCVFVCLKETRSEPGGMVQCSHSGLSVNVSV